MDSVEFFSKNFSNHKKLVRLMKDSRNYYTHYFETSKEIWTPNQLLYANNLLRQLVKGVLLKRLELPDMLINRLLNKQVRDTFSSL